MTDVTLTMTPARRSRIAGSTARIIRTAPNTLVSNRARISAIGISSMAPADPMPALFTRLTGRDVAHARARRVLPWARRSDLVSLVARDSAVPPSSRGTGPCRWRLVGGLAPAVIVGRRMRSLIDGVEPWDWVSSRDAAATAMVLAHLAPQHARQLEWSAAPAVPSRAPRAQSFSPWLRDHQSVAAAAELTALWRAATLPAFLDPPENQTRTARRGRYLPAFAPIGPALRP
jgi:hypothetical protein